MKIYMHDGSCEVTGHREVNGQEQFILQEMVSVTVRPNHLLIDLCNCNAITKLIDLRRPVNNSNRKLRVQ